MEYKWKVAVNTSEQNSVGTKDVRVTAFEVRIWARCRMRWGSLLRCRGASSKWRMEDRCAD